MASLVDYNLNDNVATLTLQNGKVNAFSHDMIDQLNACLDEAEKAEVVVVITGQPGILSGGYDLKVMTHSEQSAKDLVKKGSTLARRLLAFPYPVIVACSGHAVAKGAFLLLSADYRIGVKGDFKIGLNEVAIGMTMHNVGVEIARARMPSAQFNRSVICAEMFSPEGAVEAGFLDVVVEPDALAATAAKAAKMLSGLKMNAHTQTKLKVRKELLETLDQAIEDDFSASISLDMDK